MCKDKGIVAFFFFFLFVFFLLFCLFSFPIQLVAIGDDALFNSNITQVKTILISGDDCLSNTNISSNFGDSARWLQSDRILTLKISCDTTYDFDVYCSKNDTCNIDCMTKGACDDMNLHCDGICNVSKGMLRSYLELFPTFHVYIYSCFIVVAFFICFFSEKWWK